MSIYLFSFRIFLPARPELVGNWLIL